MTAKADWLDGVVLSGGEPTINPALLPLARRIKQLGLGLKLDTNGSKPDVLSEMLSEDLLDYVAMDVKSSPERYAKAVRRPVSVEAVQRSIELITEAGIDHEFRTTMVPTLVDRTDALKIAAMVARGNKYVLQQFNPKVTLDPEIRLAEPYSAGYLRGVAEECGEFLPTTVRGAG